MQDSDLPAKFPIPWANSAGPAYIRTPPVASQIGVQNGAASLTDGFPPNTGVPIAAGGSWPYMQDFNGILKQITQWERWRQAGGPIPYDAAFQTAIGGYPRGAIVGSYYFGYSWLSLVDGNMTNPDSGGAGWHWSGDPATYDASYQAAINGYPKGAIVASPVNFGNRWLSLVAGNMTNPDTGGAGWRAIWNQFSNLLTFTTSGTFTVPQGVTLCRVRLWGGGGPGGPGNGGGGGGGSAGGYCEAYLNLTGISSVAVTVAAALGTTSFGSMASATGGTTGGAGPQGAGATVFGNGVGGGLNAYGESGQNGAGASGLNIGGKGGAAFGFQGGLAAFLLSTGNSNGNNPQAGGGGGGGVGEGLGGVGGLGLATVEW